MNHPIVRLTQQARLLSADMETPISLFSRLSSDGILLESAEVDGRWGRYSVLVCDYALMLSCQEGRLCVRSFDPALSSLEGLNGTEYVSGLREVLAHLEIIPPTGMDLPPITRALYGYFGFGMAALFSARLARTMPVSEAESVLVLPSTVLVFDHLYNRLCQISLSSHQNLVGRGTPQPLEPVAPEVPRTLEDLASDGPLASRYTQMVGRIKELLVAGEAIQVVPSVRFETEYAGDPFTLYRRMRQINASPYMFYMQLNGQTLFGSSPEVMVRCRANQMTLSPIAGTRRRGRDEREDGFLASELLNDPKERAEHVMLVDLGRNDLGRVARAGTVKVDRFMEIERFSHVMHITSTVTAALREGADALDILAATFPAGTVSGAPKIRALEIIRELEGEARGPYAGAIGWIGLDHDSVNLDLGITIRSMWQKEGRLFWQAGGGIVHDSDAASEWQEVCNKSAIMRHVLTTGGEGHVSAD